jgi:hypothetical protein
MADTPPLITVKTEPLGMATRVVGLVDGREVIAIGNSTGSVWTVGGSTCLPNDLGLAVAYLECMRRAMDRAREHGAPLTGARPMSAATASGKKINITHFDEVRIDQITSGAVPMTVRERAFLVSDTARFEECCHSVDQLGAMTDKDLMNVAYGVWAEYASGQV